MDWLHKLRRTFTLLSSRIKLRKSGAGVVGRCRRGGGADGECGKTSGGLLNLRDDVEMCGYKDVEIMWNMLSLSITPERMETPRNNIKQKLPRRSCKQRFNSRLFFWTNHNP
ncbi:uncharacterized protein LOC123906077 [Trifolium pratense]|uniref:uncharacterized protein LOC123906077 n=1 Tax=Trifolium pratense TaxID=57577 RepID=UPI001E691E9F|nr:uncharacterized protein LOC123906077 [Trifolium pratense]